MDGITVEGQELPVEATITREVIEQAIDRFLRKQRVSLYLNWLITQEDSMTAAREFLTDMWFGIWDEVASGFAAAAVECGEDGKVRQDD